MNKQLGNPLKELKTIEKNKQMGTLGLKKTKMERNRWT